jgi:hypothetical protein
MERSLHTATAKVYGFTPGAGLLNHDQRKVKGAFTLLEPSCGYGGRMDMGFDIGRIGVEHAAEHGFGAPEWSAMRARLEAQWVARRALSRAGEETGGVTGSFNSPVACALVAYRSGTPSVNPTALGNGKPIGSIGDDTAITQPIGGRGYR